MIEVTIPGYGTLRLDYLVLDHNGTLAVDGLLVPGVRESLEKLAEKLEIFVVTADTFGRARAQLEGIPCQLTILPPGDQDRGKLAFVDQLGRERTVCIGNGRNDALMLEAAALGIAVILAEGAAVATLNAADVVCVGIIPALELLMNPLRLTATLRS
ncbi:MAG: ATPase P [Desulfobacterales bacterium]